MNQSQSREHQHADERAACSRPSTSLSSISRPPARSASMSYGRKGRCARGNPVVDDDRDLAPHFGSGPISQIVLSSSFNLSAFPPADNLEFLSANAR